MPQSQPNSARPVALITGASSGIGAALAREAAKGGHDLILVARRREPMQALASELTAAGAVVTILEKDLSQSGASASLIDAIEQRGLAIDMLINNAGLGDNGPFDRADLGRVDQMLQVNVVALTELTRLVLPKMQARGRGRIMLVASTAAFQPGPGMAVYYATKAYVLSFGQAIAYELGGSGISVTTLCPGPTETEFAQVAHMEGVALFKGPMPIMSAAEVAHRGYQALLRGQRVVVTGLVNSMLALSARFTPTSVLLFIANRVNAPL